MFGGQAAYFQKYLDWSKLTFGDMIDPRRGFIYQTGDVPRGDGSHGFFDVSAGMVGFTKNFYFGVAAHHLNRPDESMILGDSRLPIRITGHMGANIKLGQRGRYSSSTTLMPNVIYQYQNGFQQFRGKTKSWTDRTDIVHGDQITSLQILDEIQRPTELHIALLAGLATVVNRETL